MHMHSYRHTETAFYVCGPDLATESQLMHHQACYHVTLSMKSLVTAESNLQTIHMEVNIQLPLYIQPDKNISPCYMDLSVPETQYCATVSSQLEVLLEQSVSEICHLRSDCQMFYLQAVTVISPIILYHFSLHK